MTEKVYSNTLLTVEAGLRANKVLHRLHLEIDKAKLQAYRELNNLAEEVGKENLPIAKPQDYWYWKSMIETLDSVEMWAKPEPTVLD